MKKRYIGKFPGGFKIIFKNSASPQKKKIFRKFPCYILLIINLRKQKVCKTDIRDFNKQKKKNTYFFFL